MWTAPALQTSGACNQSVIARGRPCVGVRMRASSRVHQSQYGSPRLGLRLRDDCIRTHSLPRTASSSRRTWADARRMADGLPLLQFRCTLASSIASLACICTEQLYSAMLGSRYMRWAVLRCWLVCARTVRVHEPRATTRRTLPWPATGGSTASISVPARFDRGVGPHCRLRVRALQRQRHSSPAASLPERRPLRGRGPASRAKSHAVWPLLARVVLASKRGCTGPALCAATTWLRRFASDMVQADTLASTHSAKQY